MGTQECYLFEYNEVKFNRTLLFSAGSLVIPSKSISLIIGKNGTGKSTLLKQVQYKYEDCIYVAQQEDQILKELSVLENLTMCQPDICDEDVENILEQLNLTHLLRHRSCELSGGEKRIISILRALFSKSSIILMDEPTNDLDYQTVDQIINILDAFKREKTILIVTHDERLYKLAETKFVINNHSIQDITQVKNRMMQQVVLPENRNALKNKNVIKTFFHQDVGRIFCMALLCLLFMVSIVNFSSILSKEIPLISENQVNFCNSMYDNSVNLLYDGYLPTSFLDLVNSNISIWDLKRKINVALEKAALLPYNLNLKLPENEFVTYYNLILYSSKTNQLVNVLDYCASNGECTAVVSDYFVLTGALADYNNLPFDNEIYSRAIRKIEQKFSDECLELVFCVALLDTSHINFFDFVSDDYFKENLNANYYVTSNETRALVQSAIQIDEMEHWGKIGFVFAGATGLLMVFNTVLANVLRKRQTEILRDYGFSFEDLKPFIRNVYSIKFSTMLCSIVIGINIFVALLFHKQTIVLVYLPSAIMTAIMVIVCWIEYYISLHFNENIFTFGGIFNDF